MLAQPNTLFTGNGTAGTFSFYGVISGATSAITKEGSSTLRLVSYDGANTFGGGLTVKAGTVQWASNNGALGSGTVTLGYSGGTEAVKLAYTSVKTGTPIASSPIVLASGHTGTITIGTVAASGTSGYSGGVTGTNDLTIAGSNGATLNFASQPINNTGTLTFTGTGTAVTTITGGIGANVTSLTKNDGGTLNFNSTMAYTGGTILNQGTLTCGTGGTPGATTSPLQVNNTNSTAAGTNVVLNLPSAANVTVGSLSGTIATPTSGTNTATIMHSGAAPKSFTVNQSADGTYAGVIACNTGTRLAFILGGLSTNTLTFSGANTYNGTTTISAGTLSLGNSLALQNSALDTLSSIAGTSTAGLKTTVTTLTLGGLIGDKDLASVFTTALGGAGGATALGGYSDVTALTLNPDNAVTYSAAIADGAAGMTLTKTGPGTQVLSGANTYTGLTTMNNASGTLTLSGDNIAAIGGVTLTNGTLNVNSATALGTGTVTLTAGTLDNTSGGAKTLSTNNAVTLSGNFAFGTSSGTANNNLNLGTGAVTNAGNWTITLNGTGTTLTFGGVMTNTSNAVQTTTVNGPGNTLVLGGYALSNNASSRIDVITGTGNVTITGAVTNGGTATASGLTYSGTGTLTLSGNNTYTGLTTVDAGTLKLAALSGSALTATSAVANNAILEVGGLAEQVGAISGTGGSTSVLDGDSLTATSIVQDTLTIGSGATLTIRPTTAGGDIGGLGNVSQQVPVPEPAAWVLLGTALLGWLVLRRR